MNAGISVSRVGGNAQIKAMKQVAGSLRLDLAQYRELAAFAQFGSDLDKATQAQLNRGARMVEVLKQGQYKPLSVEKQVLILFAGSDGCIDKFPVEAVKRYEEELFTFFESKKPELLKEIKEQGKLGDELEKKLLEGIGEFEKTFSAE